MSARPAYEYEYVTTSTDAVPSALQGTYYWYDSGTELNSQPIYYDSTDTYGFWYNTANWNISTIETIDLDPAGVFQGDTTSLIGAGTYSGTITMDTNNITDAWNKAERAVFTSLISFLGGNERVNAFRGRFPTNEAGEIKYRNVWKIDSGGAASAYDAERTYGDDGNWCNLMMDGEIEGYFKSRVVAMNFASSVLAWLRHTDNLKTVSGSNVTWCMLTDLPQPPEPTVGVKKVMWTVVIPIQILYLTSGEY